MKKTFSKQLPNEISNFFIFIGISLFSIFYCFVLNYLLNFGKENNTLPPTDIFVFFLSYGIMCFVLAMLLSDYLLYSKKRELFFIFDNNKFSRSFLDSIQNDNIAPIYLELDAEYKQRNNTYVKFSINTVLFFASAFFNTLSAKSIYIDGVINLDTCYNLSVVLFTIIMFCALTAILYFLKAREYKIIKQKLIEEITKQSTPTISNIPACSFVYTESPQISCDYQNNTPSL